MERDLEKRFVTLDGKHRVNIYREECPEDPRGTTDEPLHCEDWSRDGSLMTKEERENRSDSAYDFLCYMLEKYGDEKKIIKILKDNYKSNAHKYRDNALFYDHSNKEWVVASWICAYKDMKNVIHEAHWAEEDSFSLSLDNIDIGSIIVSLNSETIDYLVANAMTDGVKMMSYSFGYYSGIYFSEEVTCDSNGICWLEKDEFLKYSGCDEEYWSNKSFRDIEWLIEEIEAWGDNEVYGFAVERAIKSVVSTHYPNGEREDTKREITEWEEEDSCWGFYGELDKIEDYILSEAGFKKEDLEVA